MKINTNASQQMNSNGKLKERPLKDNNELGKRLDLILDFQKEIYRRQRDEGQLEDTDLEERLNSLI